MVTWPWSNSLWWSSLCFVKRVLDGDISTTHHQIIVEQQSTFTGILWLFSSIYYLCFLFFLHFACAMFLSVLRWVTVYGYTVLVCSQPLRLTQPQWDGKWVPGKRQWCVAGKVTVGLTSHWLCITDSARYIYLAAYWPEEGIEYSACTSVWHPLHVC